ncbi:MAG: serine/threonine-protein kinase [Pseudomonadota bacterium]
MIKSNKMTMEDAESSKLFPGRYEIRGMVGRGNLGRVFLAFDKNIEREVAAKELSGDPEHKAYQIGLMRLIREAKITGALEHPGIVPIYDFGTKSDGTFYYTMRRIAGIPLYQAINECKSPTPEESFKKRIKLLDSFIDVCDALGYAHSKGLIHRDLKPEHIILGKFGETVILDWGLVKKVGDKDELSLDTDADISKYLSQDVTVDGTVLGTPSFMSPEQANPKHGAIDQRSDVYSLGCILYVILTGEKPYQRDREHLFERLQSSDPSPSPKKVVPYIPRELCAICEKAMAKQSAFRFENASELANELKAYRDGRLISIYSYTRKELMMRFIERNKTLVGAIGIVIIAIVVGLGLALHFGYEARDAKEVAENALTDVTALSESSTKYSKQIVSDLNLYFDDLAKAMTISSKGISKKGLDDKAGITHSLRSLHEKYPRIKTFEVIEPPARVLAASPKALDFIIVKDLTKIKNPLGYFDERQGLFSQTFRTLDGVQAVSFQVPVFEGGKVVASLVALIDTENLIPALFSQDPLSSPYQVWCMQGDGNLLYDEDKVQIGRNLFSDEMYAKFPELLKFGEDMRSQEWGVGNYAFLNREKSGKTYKVAAWDTFGSDYGVNWKVVVSYPYIAKK